jgi:predicted nucleotidyltransferase
MATRKEILFKIKKTVSELDPEARVILFGSRARGDYGKESDWDLLILTSIPATEENKRNLRYHLLDIELETEQAISTLIHHHDHWKNYYVTPLYDVIEKEGIEV